MIRSLFLITLFFAAVLSGCNSGAGFVCTGTQSDATYFRVEDIPRTLAPYMATLDPKGAEFKKQLRSAQDSCNKLAVSWEIAEPLKASIRR